MPRTQDEECTFINDCHKGETCGFLFDPEQTTPTEFVAVCSFMCTPEGELLPDGTTIGCDYLASQQPAPPDERTNGPGSGYECRYLSGFYRDTGEVPPHVGMCVNTAVWGACADVLDDDDPSTTSRGCERTFPEGNPLTRELARPSFKNALESL